MFATLVLHLASVFWYMCYLFSTFLHKEELHTQQLAYNIHLKVHVDVALTLFLIH